MPAKKHTKKTKDDSKKKKRKKKAPTKKRKTSKKSAVKKDIAKAVEQIPAIITEEIREEEVEVKKPTLKSSRKTHAHHFMYEHHHVMPKKKLLWFGVICLTVVMIAMWALNTRVFLYQITQQGEALKSPTVLLNVKDDFQKVLDATKREEAKREATKAQVEKQIKTAESEIKLEQGLKSVIKEKTQPKELDE